MADKKKNLKVETNLKYLLGDMGLEILLAITKGASKKETIKLISGVPMECINGRLPVLIDLDLITNTNEGYITTKRGSELIDRLKLKEKGS